MSTEKIDNMIELSLNKKNLLNEILKLTKDQSLIINENDFEKLDLILDKKSKSMSDVDELDKKFLKLYSELKKEEDIESLEDIDSNKFKNIVDLKKIVSDLYSILEEISVIDKANTSIMDKHLEEIKSELKGVKDVKKAYKGYNYEPDISILLDEKK